MSAKSKSIFEQFYSKATAFTGSTWAIIGSLAIVLILHKYYSTLSELTRNKRDIHETHSINEAEENHEEKLYLHQ